jgi:uncharacterized OsmC-like protein
MTEHRQFTVTLARISGYEFEATFDSSQVGPIMLDEPEPLGAGRGPNASRLIGAAVGNCLSASLLFCLEKAKQQVRSIDTRVVGAVRRNARGRQRLAQLDVQLTIDVGDEQPERVKRCLDLFEEYCVVTESVRKGIEINVAVTDPDGADLYRRMATGPEPRA